MILNSPFISGSLTVTGNTILSGSITSLAGIAGTASYATNAEMLDGLDSTSFLTTSSFNTVSSSFAGRIVSNEAKTGSYATTGSNQFNGSQTVTGSLTATGTITAQTLVVQTITSSVEFVTGSAKFGSTTANTHQFTGSIYQSGSVASFLGSVGVGTSSPSYPLTINANSTQTSIGLMSGYNNSGARNWGIATNALAYGDLNIAQSSASGSDPFSGNSRFYIAQSGNIGIGTTSGFNAISGTETTLAITNSNVASLYLQSTATNNKWGLYAAAVGNFAITNTSSSIIPFTITSGGNIGIGTASPSDILDVQKNQNATTNFYFRNTDTTNNSSRAYLNVIAGSTSLTLATLNNGDVYIAGTSGKNMYFQQNIGGTVNMTISGSGTIGIGTSTPGRKLVIYGGTTDAGLEIFSSNGTRTAIIAGRGSSSTALHQGYFQMTDQGTATVALDTAGNSYLTGGNVGIGTSSPSSLLELNKASTSSILRVLGGGDGTGGGKGNIRSGDQGGTNYFDFGRDNLNTGNFVLTSNGGSSLLSITTSGATTFASSVTAGGFLANDSTTISIPIDTGASKAYFDASSINGPGLTVRADSVGRTIRLTSNGTGSTIGAIDVNSTGLGLATNTSHPIIFSPQATEKMRITTGGSLLLGTTANLSSGAGTQSMVIRNGTNGQGLYFASVLNAADQYIPIGTQYDTANGNNRAEMRFAIDGSDTNTRITFHTAAGIGTLNERMRISSPGDLYLYNGSFQQQGVWTVFNTGYTAGTSTFNVDIGVGDEGGGGNIFKVEAGFAHYFSMAYNCLAEFYISSRGTGTEITDVKRVDTGNGGSFTASKPSSTILRITKTAGSYGGGGRYWIKVTKVDY